MIFEELASFDKSESKPLLYSFLIGIRLYFPMSFPYVDVEQTFGDFLEEFGAEVSDRTLSGSNKPTNADYVFHDEKVIAELKLLKKDPFENKDFKKSFVNKQREWLQKGYITLTQLRSITKIKQLPDKCYNDMVKLYRSPIKTHIDKANDQIKKTKARLNVPDRTLRKIIETNERGRTETDLLKDAKFVKPQ